MPDVVERAEDCTYEYPSDGPSWTYRLKRWWCHRTNHRAPVMELKRDDGLYWWLCRRCQHAITNATVNWVGTLINEEDIDDYD